MRVHITNINGISHNSTASICQFNTLKIAREMGFDEMGLYKMNTSWDSPSEFSKRMDGIISPLWSDDIVILQLPTWSDLAYENRLVSKIRAYSNTKIIMFIHDVAALQTYTSEDIVRGTVELYNKADVLILPSKKMHTRLIEAGLTIDKIIYQELWDYPMSHMLENHNLKRQLFFTGDSSKFQFVKNWQFKTPLELYGNTPFDFTNLNIQWHGYKEHMQLISDLSVGGFGLVWADGDVYEYCKLIQPFKLATYLAAGIPVIIRDGFFASDYVRKHNVGFVVNSLDEVDEIVQSITNEDYSKLLYNVKQVQFLITNGFYTRKLLTEAVIMAAEK